MSGWKIQDSLELYNVNQWGANFFSINAAGHVEVYPTGDPNRAIDLKIMADEIQKRGIQLPLLIRFSDILRTRIKNLCESFQSAMQEYHYQAVYRGVYPIKVNQQRQVVATIVDAAKAYHFGLEAGSKPELLTTVATLKDPEALIVCNGYKDEEYIELALLARRVGKNVILVVEKLNELELIAQMAEKLHVEPSIGLRVRLSAKGSGRWEASGGDRSKFGLGPVEMLQAIEWLKGKNLLGSVQLLHYHLGSQITAIRNVKDALREAARYYVELKQMGAALKYLDVGGGLAVDYDGSRTNFAASANYSMQEYANDVVYQIMTTCDEAKVEHPIIVSESGRAITAYHSVLLFNVLGVTEFQPGEPAAPSADNTPPLVKDLWESYQSLSRKNFQEVYHDIQHAREQLLNMFNLGYVNLPWRAYAEAIYWAANYKIYRLAKESSYVPDELEGLEKSLADIYFCNFSLFQSLPDTWAIDQIFPIMPIHRLNEKPTRSGILADITCDSDGCIDRFVDLRNIKDVIGLHPWQENEDYLIGIFLVGAYQEILGDLHNLFGDNNVVQIALDGENHSYKIEHVEYGDSVSEVLAYVQQSKDELISRFRQSVEQAVRAGNCTLEEARHILETYRAGFEGYTYMER